MRVLLVHPSALMYSEIFLRLEPLGLERVAAALLADGHEVRLLDLQVYRARRAAAPGGRVPARGGRLQPQLPGQRARGRRPGQVGQDRCCPAAWSSPAATASRSWPSTSSRTPTAPSTSCSRARARPSPRALLAAASRTGPWPRCPAWSPPDGPGRRAADAAQPGLITCPRATWAGAAASTSSACSTRPPRSSSPAAARGTARSAAPGPSTAAATASCHPRPPPRTWRASTSPACSSSTTWPSSRPSTATRSPASSSAASIRKQYYLETRCDVLLRNEEVFRRWRRLGLELHVPRPRGARRGGLEGASASAPRPR